MSPSLVPRRCCLTWDLAAFGRMLLNGGELNGKRYLSTAALAQMTSKQTGTLSAN